MTCQNNFTLPRLQILFVKVPELLEIIPHLCDYSKCNYKKLVIRNALFTVIHSPVRKVINETL